MEDNKELEVTILSVDKENSTIEVENDTQEVGVFKVVKPADIKYAKEGKAIIKFNPFGSIGYVRSSEPKKTNSFKPFTQKNTFKPSDDYVPEEKESKRIGVTKIVTNTSLQDISLIYNSMSTEGKWIVATNIFPKGDKYDAIFFISEKREGFNKVEYLKQSNSTDHIKEESVGYM